MYFATVTPKKSIYGKEKEKYQEADQIRLSELP